MAGFQPHASLENYIGRRLLILLAALALADIVILLSISLSTFISAIPGSPQAIVRTRALEILNANNQPVLVATTDKGQNGILWVGTQNGKGGVNLNVDELGNGLIQINTASGNTLVSAFANDR